MRELSDFERGVFDDANTERPFSSELNKEYRDGKYRCKRCDNMLFNSESKFNSNSGWPSFTNPSDKSNIVTKTDSSHGKLHTYTQTLFAYFFL